MQWKRIRKQEHREEYTEQRKVEAHREKNRKKKKRSTKQRRKKQKRKKHRTKKKRSTEQRRKKQRRKKHRTKTTKGQTSNVWPQLSLWLRIVRFTPERKRSRGNDELRGCSACDSVRFLWTCACVQIWSPNHTAKTFATLLTALDSETWTYMRLVCVFVLLTWPLDNQVFINFRRIVNVNCEIKT